MIYTFVDLLPVELDGLWAPRRTRDLARIVAAIVADGRHVPAGLAETPSGGARRDTFERRGRRSPRNRQWWRTAISICVARIVPSSRADDRRIGLTVRPTGGTGWAGKRPFPA